MMCWFFFLSCNFAETFIICNRFFFCGGGGEICIWPDMGWQWHLGCDTRMVIYKLTWALWHKLIIPALRGKRISDLRPAWTIISSRGAWTVPPSQEGVHVHIFVGVKRSNMVQRQMQRCSFFSSGFGCFWLLGVWWLQLEFPEFCWLVGISACLLSQRESFWFPSWQCWPRLRLKEFSLCQFLGWVWGKSVVSLMSPKMLQWSSLILGFPLRFARKLRKSLLVSSS